MCLYKTTCRCDGLTSLPALPVHFIVIQEECHVRPYMKINRALPTAAQQKMDGQWSKPGWTMHSVDIYRSLEFISNHGLMSLGPSGFHQFVHVKIPHGQIKMSSQ